MNFAQRALNAGGQIAPLIIKNLYFKGTNTLNPSVYYDAEADRIFVSIRHSQYTLYYSKKDKIEDDREFVYIFPECGNGFETKNYICELDRDLNIIWESLIDTSKLDVKPLWWFFGLEDIRLVKWGGDLYAAGSRRDTTIEGQGRIELSKLEVSSDQSVVETFRYRMPAPEPNDSYSEKNWMPIVDMPFCFVRWTNPTEVIKVNPLTNVTETIFLNRDNNNLWPTDLRGGSQVVTIGNYRYACVHNSNYEHIFVVWDMDWNIVNCTKPFSLIDADLEFCSGLTLVGDYLILSFGCQDNLSYVLKVPVKLVEDMCLKINSVLQDYVHDTNNPDKNIKLAKMYEEVGHLSAAIHYYSRAAERTDDINIRYYCLIKVAKCFEIQGNRFVSVKKLYRNCIDLIPSRPEAYYFLSKIHEIWGEYPEVHNLLNLAFKKVIVLENLQNDFQYEYYMTSIEYIKQMRRSIIKPT